MCYIGISNENGRRSYCGIAIVTILQFSNVITSGLREKADDIQCLPCCRTEGPVSESAGEARMASCEAGGARTRLLALATSPWAGTFCVVHLCDLEDVIAMEHPPHIEAARMKLVIVVVE